MGRVPPINCLIEYNQAIFKHLDSVYGEIWRKEVNNDIIGIKDIEER